LELDEADIAILGALQRDARYSMRELARLAGVSTPTASAKVKALEAKGALKSFGALLAPEALGESVLVIEGRSRPADAARAARKLAALPEVRACHLLGSGRILAIATLLDPALQNDFLKKLGAVAELESFESHPLLETLKELPAAVIDRGVMLAVRCEFCGRRTKDEVLRVKVGAITHFVCCKSCKTGFVERMGRLSKLAGKGRGASDLKIIS
jgi:Lrp/AsnC family leucine-responsive transcriptional regulator